MWSKRKIFLGPSSLGISYEEGVKDVRREMEALILKKPPAGRSEEWKNGWNGAIIALSKAIRFPDK